MASKTLRVQAATYARSSYPSREFYTTAKSRIRVQADTSVGYLYSPSPVPHGATVSQAYFEVTFTAAFPFVRTLTLQRLGATKPFQQLNWANRPAVADGSVPVDVTQNGNTTTWRFDVTADYAAYAAGAKNTGFRLRTTTTDVRYLYGFQARDHYPTLTITWSLFPPAPTNLVPAEGAVSVDKPVLQFHVGDDATKVQVQIDPAGNFTTPTWDSGDVVSDVGRLDLAATNYPGLALNATTYWRARVSNDSGWSDWSDVHSFNRVAKPVVTIISPVAVTGDTTPPILWSCAGQAAWKVTITVDGKIVDDTGWRSGTDDSYTPAKGTRINGQQATVRVYCQDGIPRVATDNDPVWASAERTYTVDFDATVNPVTELFVEQDRLTPAIWITFARADVPDEIAIFRDGVLQARFSAPDAFDGGVFSYKDWTCPPNRESVYRVAPITNGVIAAGGPERAITPVVEGIWVVDPDTERWFTLAGTDGISLTLGESSVVHVPLSAAAAIIRRSGLRGLEGTITGTLMDEAGRSWVEMEGDLLSMREESALVARLIMGDTNIATPLPGLSSVIDAENSLTDAIVKTVTFGVYEQPDEVVAP